MSTTTIDRKQEFPFIVRVLWFLLVGWYIAGVWIGVAWLLSLTIIGLPFGLWMLNRVPLVLTLRSTAYYAIGTVDKSGRIGLRRVPSQQHPLVVRALYFALVGWWLSLLWSIAAWALCVSLIGMPLGAWMFNRLPEVTTLMRQ